MARKKKLPPNVRRHGTGYRGVVSRQSKRVYGPVYDFPEDAAEWVLRFREAAETMDLALARPTLEFGLQEILRDLRSSGGRPGTVSFYENHAKVLMKRLGGQDRTLDSIGPADLQGYVVSRLDDGVSPGTVRKELGILKRMWGLVAKVSPLPVCPLDSIRLPKARTARFHALPKAKVLEVIEKIRGSKYRTATRDADLVMLLWLTGIRRAELSRMKPEHLDVENHRIWIEGKTNDRYQKIPKSAVGVLERLVAQSKDGRITTWRTVEKVFERWKDRLGLPYFSPHVIRHSFATEMAKHVKLLDLQHLMGHTSTKQTARYYHASDDAVQSALDGLHEPEQKTGG